MRLLPLRMHTQPTQGPEVRGWSPSYVQCQSITSSQVTVKLLRHGETSAEQAGDSWAERCMLHTASGTPRLSPGRLPADTPRGTDQSYRHLKVLPKMASFQIQVTRYTNKQKNISPPGGWGYNQ